MVRREHGSVTISEVAAAAGVSRQTVSNVLNAPGRVAPATMARVQRTIDELGYRPNRAARNLRGRTSRCIGFMIHPLTGVSNLLDRFLHALAEAAEGVGYHVLIFAPAPVAEQLAAYEDLIRTGTVDGFVLADVAHEDRRLPWFAERGIPFVCFGRPWGHDAARFSWADVDGAYGIEQAVEHLIALGHRRVAYLGWPAGTGFGDERRAGWQQRMRQHGAATEGLDGACPEDVATATKVARALLAQPDPPTAFACGSDTYAVAARLAGGVDPAGLPNVEVVGFDDSPAAMLMSPPMSSVRQPVTEVARHLVGLLMDQVHDTGVPADGMMFHPELVARGAAMSGG